MRAFIGGLLLGGLVTAAVVYAQADLRSLGEKRDAEILVRLSVENDLLKRQLQVVTARCP